MLIGLTTWRRRLDTAVEPQNDLFTLTPTYTASVERAGGVPVLLPHLDAGSAREVVARLDAVVLTGGDDVDPARYGADNEASNAVDPATDASDVAVLEAALELGKPVLGICRGLQITNVAFGGTLHQHIWGRDDHPDMSDWPAEKRWAYRHPVSIEPGSSLADLVPDRAGTTSLHHQSADRIGDGLRVVARTDDGTVEAVEHAEHRLLAVQWHPERMAGEPAGDPLFDWLLDAARGRS